MIFVVQKVLGVWENLEILLFEHFVEHEKLIWVLHVPKARVWGRDYSEFCVLFRVTSSKYAGISNCTGGIYWINSLLDKRMIE